MPVVNRARRTFFPSLPVTARLGRGEKYLESNMWRLGNSRAWRAILLAWGLTLIWLPTELMAGTLNSTGSVDRAGRSHEPFGLSTATVTTGALPQKWLFVQRQGDQ